MVHKNIIYNLSSNFRFKLSKASGSYLWDDKGHKLIDFTSGWNVTNLGWNNPEITVAMIAQAKKNTYAAMWMLDVVQEKYAKYFGSLLPKGLNVFSRETAGVNADVMAIKAARAFTGKKKILGFSDSFHGSLYGVLEICYRPEYQLSKSLFLDYKDYFQMEFPRVQYDGKNGAKILKEFAVNLDKILAKKEFAAVVCEAGIITGWGSTYVAPDGFLKTVRELTKKHGVLLILDEVGTGFSRCGKLFGMQLENVTPDIATFAKGISNGAAAIGTMVTTSEIADKVYAISQPQSTFGWNPVAVAAALKTLEIHVRDKVWEKSKKDGEYLVKTLRGELKDNDLIDEVWGKGLEVGVTFKKGKENYIDKILEKAFSEGLHMRSNKGSGYQLMPPLTIDRKTLDRAIEIFVRAVRFFA